MLYSKKLSLTNIQEDEADYALILMLGKKEGAVDD
jgi:hypothetical protein